MLALSLLVTSQSHIFVSFFKIFFMICLFGLFHGLILLPVVLAILGPVEADDRKVHLSKKQESGVGKYFCRYKNMVMIRICVVE